MELFSVSNSDQTMELFSDYGTQSKPWNYFLTRVSFRDLCGFSGEDKLSDFHNLTKRGAHISSKNSILIKLRFNLGPGENKLIEL